MIKRFHIDPKIDEDTQRFFKRLIYTLIVLNLLIGIPTIYYEYFHDHTPKIIRDISTIQTDEV